MKVPPLAALAFLAAAAPAAAAAPDLPPVPFKVGQAFPEVALPSAEDGKPVSLASFRGRKVILHVFASW